MQNETYIKNIYIECEDEFISLKEIDSIIVTENDKINIIFLTKDKYYKSIKYFDNILDAEEYVQNLQNLNFKINHGK